MAKHWKKRRAMPLSQRNFAWAITTRWFRTLSPSLRRYVSMRYNGYNSARTES